MTCSWIAGVQHYSLIFQTVLSVNIKHVTYLYLYKYDINILQLNINQIRCLQYNRYHQQQQQLLSYSRSYSSFWKAYRKPKLTVKFRVWYLSAMHTTFVWQTEKSTDFRVSGLRLYLYCVHFTRNLCETQGRSRLMLTCMTQH